jgi:hypothetical protein
MLIARGLGFGLLPYSIVARDTGQQKFAMGPVDGMTLTHFLVSRTGHGATRAVATLAGIIRSEFIKLDEEQAFSGELGSRTYQ